MNAEDFLQRDYELKVRYLTDHFQRMWTRFNFFVTIEAALIGGKLIFGEGKLNPGMVTLGAVLSFIWYVFGAEDRYLVRVYRKHVEDTAEKVAQTVWTDDAQWRAYRRVGEIEETGRDLRKDDSEKSFIDRVIEGLSGWRFELVSTTKLASLFPLFVFVVWLGVLTFEFRTYLQTR